MTLKTRILALILMVILLPLTALSVMWSGYAEQQARELILARDHHLLEQTTRPLASHFSALMLETQLLAQSPDLKSLEWARIRPFLDSLAEHGPLRFDTLFVSGADGTFHATGLDNPDRGEGEKRAQEAARTLIQDAFGQPFPAGSRPQARLIMTHPTSTQPERQLVVTAPILGPQGETLGLVGGISGPDSIQGFVDQMTSDLAERLESRVSLVLVDGDGTPVTQTGTVIQQSWGEALLTGQETHRWMVDLENGDASGILRHPIGATSYSLIVKTPAQRYRKPFEAFRLKTYFIFLGALLLSLPLFYVLLRRVFRPLERLSLFSRHTSLGRSVAFLPSQKKDEIAELGRQMQQMTATLQAREAKLQGIIDSAIDSVISLDAQGRVVEWNSAAEQLFGYSRQAMLGHTLAPIMSAAGHRKHAEGVRRAAQSPDRLDPVPREITGLDASGAPIPCELTLSKWYEGTTACFTGVIRDLRERKQSQRMLERISQRLAGKSGEDFLQQLVLGLAEVCQTRYAFISRPDPDGVNATTLSAGCDGATIANFSYPLADSPCGELIQGINLDEDIRVIPSHVTRRYPDHRLLRKMRIEGYAGTRITNSEEQTLGVLVIIDDKPIDQAGIKNPILKLYAARVATELQRLENEKSLRLAAIAFETFEGIAITDERANILRVNRAFERITGYLEAEVVGKNPRILQSGLQDAHFYRGMWRQVVEKGTWQGEIWNRRKSGEIYPEWLCITAVKDSRGIATNYIATFLDIKEKQQQQIDIERRTLEERIIGEILQCGLQPSDLDSFLDQALKILVGQTLWINDQWPNSVFLRETEGAAEPFLTRRARLGEMTGKLGECQGVNVGQCCCGQAALSRQLHYRTGKTLPHAIAPDQAVYAVPILEDDKLMGILQVSLPRELEREPRKEQFLQRVAGVLSLGISKRIADQALKHQAYHDALTGLGNRLLLEDRATQAIHAAQRRREHTGLIFIDLDRFKNINDALGHSAGNSLLRQMARRLERSIRAEDTLARVGGDEFVILLPLLGCDSAQALERVARVGDKILAQIVGTYLLGGAELKISCSLGAMVAGPAEADYEVLLRNADMAMYQAKAAGRNCLRFFEVSMQRAIEQRLSMEQALSGALENDEFRLVFQPQVDRYGRVVSAEALIRWHKPGVGIVSPLEFIPVAEETGLIIPIGNWVIRAACRFIKRLEAAAQGPIHVAVNVSAIQFCEPTFAERLQACLLEHGVDPRHLGIELTESLLVDDIDQTRDTMNRIRATGVSIAIDDFGTGYCSLSYLKDLPIDVLKIDRVFVRDVHRQDESAAIAEAILAMAKNLGLGVISEGVETAEELSFLEQRGCRRFQGFYFSKPLEEECFIEFYRNSHDRPLPGDALGQQDLSVREPARRGR